jgi:hypothetical protein
MKLQIRFSQHGRQLFHMVYMSKWQSYLKNIYKFSKNYYHSTLYRTYSTWLWYRLHLSSSHRPAVDIIDDFRVLKYAKMEDYFEL